MNQSDSMYKAIQMHGFPSNVSAEEVKEFLEQRTGNGTVYALKVGKPKEGDPRTHAKVQFIAKTSVETIFSLVSRRLLYGNSYLTATEMKHDIVPRPIMFLHVMDNIAVNFGCPKSKDKFSVLWKHEHASVKFMSELRKMFIFFCYLSMDYKLEISSESIWQVKLHRPRGLAKQFLLVQFLRAPLIYEKDISTRNYFKEVHDNPWLREVDFTPSCCIGQSSALCLELPQTTEIPNFHDHSHNFEENYSGFILESGYSFSCNLTFVPMVAPPEGFNLPYKILFKVNSLVQHGFLPGQAIDMSFFELVDPHRIKLEYIESALDKLYHTKDCCYEPVTWLQKQYESYHASSQLPQSPSISLDDGLMYVHRVQVTPSKVYFCGPEVILSNGVIRRYPYAVDNFLRVSFVDEDLDKLHSKDLLPRSSSKDADRPTKIHERILSTLQNGIVIGNKKFEFLAFSSSQLRDNSLWMFASEFGVTASHIRNQMGDFSEIRIVAKYAARLGQSFSSSRETLRVHKRQVEIIPDVEITRGEIKYCFSDGIGKISAELAENVAKKCGLKDSVPSAFQIRYAGYKGVVAIDPNLSKKMALRKSMCKYKSKGIKLDVLSWSRYQPCYLNRQIIALLSTLGVKDRVFEKKQREIVNQLNMIQRDPLRAQVALDLMSSGEMTNVLKKMLVSGYRPAQEPFLSMMLQTLRASKLQELRVRTRILVQKGRAMLGCLDETRTLEYGQVFVQLSHPRNKQVQGLFSLALKGSGPNKSTQIIKGKVVVAKNPCLHPGDVRVLRAVDVPALHHMVDCVVFPQKGKRPHPNECSGSDLDGDVYFVSWDPDLIPPRQEKPMDHAPAQVSILDRDVELQEVEEFFTNYIINDSLGIIASAHTVFADHEPLKAMSPSCIALAELHTVAVDFAKTGKPAEIPRHLHVKEYPDFMEKTDKPSYESKSVIGKLYREVKNLALQVSPKKPFTRNVARQCYDYDMEIAGFEKYVSEASKYKTMYDYKLGNLMDYYGIETEAEIISGNILKTSKSFDERKDLEGIIHAVKSLRKEARSWFNEMISKQNSQGDDDTYAIASAWYHVTYHPNYWGCNNEGLKRDHFLSFAWCVYDKLTQIKKEKASGTNCGMKLCKVIFITIVLLILVKSFT